MVRHHPRHHHRRSALLEASRRHPLVKVPSLAATITIITGIVGASFGTFALDVLRVKDMTARGFAFGLASHGIGTARAMSKNKTAGVFAALALGLSGIATSILIPLLFKLINF